MAGSKGRGVHADQVNWFVWFNTWVFFESLSGLFFEVIFVCVATNEFRYITTSTFLNLIRVVTIVVIIVVGQWRLPPLLQLLLSRNGGCRHCCNYCCSAMVVAVIVAIIIVHQTKNECQY